MKKLNQIRKDYDMITEKEENEERKLVALVRAGLFDAKKLPALKKALDKTADKMTGQEKRMLLNLLDELMSQVITNQPVYQKVKQNLMKEEKSSGFPVDQTIPSVILLKRKAIRTFPNGQKVALYYAQSIDKYVSIPYNEVGLSEEVELDENALKLLQVVGGAVAKYGPKAAKGAAELAKKSGSAAGNLAKKTFGKTKSGIKKVRDYIKNRRGKIGAGAGVTAGAKVGYEAGKLSSNSGGSSSGSSEPKYFTPMSSKLRANVSGPKREGGSDTRAERERQASLRASKSMANEAVKLNLDGNIFELNNIASRKVTSLYESLNKKNKKKMVEMMKESNESLEKVVSFAVRQ